MREVCAATALLGQDIRRVFLQPDFFLDYLTAYYTDAEPEAALVVEAEGRIVGYLLGCCQPQRYRRYRRRQLPGLVGAGLRTLLSGSTTPLGRRFLAWVLWAGWREMPRAPQNAAHFHFNLLPAWQNRGVARQLVDTWLARLREHRVELAGVYGQMETFPGRRTAALFQRLGWRVYDQVPLSKYRWLFGRDAAAPQRAQGEVFLTTLYRAFPAQG